MSTLHVFAFWVCVACVVVGAVLGIAGIWLPRTENGWKLFMTDVVVAVSALIVACITKWLT
jgi:hypothetical protein